MMPSSLKNNTGYAVTSTRLDFIRGIVEKATKQQGKICFYVGDRSIQIEQEKLTYNLIVQEVDTDTKITFKIGYPGPQGFTYCAQRIMETFPEYGRILTSQYDLYEEDDEPSNC